MAAGHHVGRYPLVVQRRQRVVVDHEVPPAEAGLELLASTAFAQDGPIKIGSSLPLTGNSGSTLTVQGRCLTLTSLSDFVGNLLALTSISANTGADATTGRPDVTVADARKEELVPR